MGKSGHINSELNNESADGGWDGAKTLDTVSGLVEEDVSRLIGGSPLGVSLTKETLNCVWLNLLQGTHKAYMSTLIITRLQSSRELGFTSTTSSSNSNQ